MFAALIEYLDPAFLRDHLEIMIVTADGDFLAYQVFYARRTDARDPMYTLDFDDLAAVESFEDAPAGASQILVLSTCAGGGDRDARVLVYAVLAPDLIGGG